MHGISIQVATGEGATSNATDGASGILYGEWPSVSEENVGMNLKTGQRRPCLPFAQKPLKEEDLIEPEHFHRSPVWFKFYQPNVNDSVPVIIRDGEGDTQCILVIGNTNCFLQVYISMSLDFSTNIFQQPFPSIICLHNLLQPHNNPNTAMLITSTLWRKTPRLRKLK